MMVHTRRFLMVGHTQSTDPDLSLNDLPGAAGRLDVVVRLVTSALCMSHGLRADTEVWTVFDHDGLHKGPRTLVWHGATLRHLNPDERSTAALFRRAFSHDAIDVFEEAHPGLEVAAFGLEEALGRFEAEGPVHLLDRDGEDIRTWGSDDDGGAPGFILSDHVPWTEVESDLFRKRGFPLISVGPHWLHGHQVVTLVHDELDRRTRDVGAEVTTAG